MLQEISFMCEMLQQLAPQDISEILKMVAKKHNEFRQVAELPLCQKMFRTLYDIIYLVEMADNFEH